ncbi:MAG: sigma-70 family RNA polymerase sigma factor [Lachnospiraceae bacterium]|nr:sigma-70 family RNA polymerase sigma factor [Lachnospiraceae bacterium]
MEELYKQNAKIIYHFLYTRCKDEALAEELLQETFLKAFESMERFDGSCKLSTWLCQIARHLLYQHWEKAKKEAAVELKEEVAAPRDTEMEAIHKVELAEVLDKLEQMPSGVAQVVKLRAMSDLSFREIGELLGKSETWARVTFFRAKKQLLQEVRHEDKL